MGLLLVKVPALTQLCCILKYPFPYSPQLYINTSVDTINLSDKSFRLETEIAEAMSLQNELSLCIGRVEDKCQCDCGDVSVTVRWAEPGCHAGLVKILMLLRITTYPLKSYDGHRQ